MGLIVNELQKTNRSPLVSAVVVFYFRSFDDDDEVGPICTLGAAPPMAIVSGEAFSCEMSGNFCWRRLNSFSLSVVSCDARLAVIVDSSGGGGLFSISDFTLSRHSTFKSGFTAASVEHVEDDADGGFGSK